MLKFSFCSRILLMSIFDSHFVKSRRRVRTVNQYNVNIFLLEIGILLTNFETTNPNFHKYFDLANSFHIHKFISHFSWPNNWNIWLFDLLFKQQKLTVQKRLLKNQEYGHIKMQDYASIYRNKISFE